MIDAIQGVLPSPMSNAVIPFFYP